MQHSIALKTTSLEKMGDFITNEFLIQLVILCKLAIYDSDRDFYKVGQYIPNTILDMLLCKGPWWSLMQAQYIGQWDFCEGARDPVGNREKRRTKKMSGVRLLVTPWGPNWATQLLCQEGLMEFYFLLYFWSSKIIIIFKSRVVSKVK